MPTVLPKEPVIEALAAEFVALYDLLRSLDESQWSLSTPCPGWDVRANVAHVIGTESMLAGIAAPEVEVDRAVRTHIKNDIGAFNEQWVVALADVPSGELLEQFREITGRRLGMLREMPQETWEEEGFTPAGPDTYGRFMRIRVFDCWMHEQDIRTAIERPGHDAGPVVDLALDEMTGAMGFVVGKKAGAPTGSSVTFDLTGDGGRLIHVAVGERAAVVPDLDEPATVTLRMPVVLFSQLAGGRVSAAEVADQVELDGDADLGRRVLEHLAYMI